MNRTTALLTAITIGIGIFGGTDHAQGQSEGNNTVQRQANREIGLQPDDPLPEGAKLRLGTSRFRNGIPVAMMAVSTDGEIAVAVNGNHMHAAMRVFDLTSGRDVYSLRDGLGPRSIEAAAISPDRKTIVTKEDFSLRIRDSGTGAELRIIALQRTNSYSRNEWVSFTPDGKAIAVTSQGKVIHLIDFESGATIREFSNENPESSLSGSFTTVLGIAFSPEGKLMASGGFANDRGDYFARLWEVETGKELRRFIHGPRSYGIESLAISPDGKTLATGSHDARLRLFDVDSGNLVKEFPANGASRMHGGCVAFSPDGKTVATAGQSLRLYDVASGEERWHDDRQALGIVFTDGGKTLTGAVMGTICRWDAATGKSLTPEGGDSPVEQIIVLADGSRIVTRGTNGDAHIWDAATGKRLRYLAARFQKDLAVSPDGRFIVWPAVDRTVQFTDPQQRGMTITGSRLQLYDVAADKFIERFAPIKGDADELWFINDGKGLLTVDHRDGQVRIWNFDTAAEERSFQVLREDEKTQSNAVWRTTLSPDGKTLAVAYVPRGRGILNQTTPIRVWSVATGGELRQFESSARYVNNLAISPDGRWLVSSGSTVDLIDDGGKLQIWNVSTGETEATLTTGACAVAFFSDGRYLATAAPHGAIRLWDTATWTQIGEFKDGHRDRPMSLAFDPNRPLLYSGSVDTCVLAWVLRLR